jgi:hypothetical protein
VLAAALLLWPFAGWSWIPWLAGLVALVLLAVLRLDRLLRGWTWHVAGLVVVGGLMVSTSPWAWALAASLGVLLAGLLQLPAWRLAAVGAVLCLMSGGAFTFATIETRQQEVAANIEEGNQYQAEILANDADEFYPSLMQSIEENDAELFCLLLGPAAEDQLSRGLGTAMCPDAFSGISERFRSSGSGELDRLAPTTTTATGGVIDGCNTDWAQVAGRSVGRITLSPADPDQETFTISGFLPC